LISGRFRYFSKRFPHPQPNPGNPPLQLFPLFLPRKYLPLFIFFSFFLFLSLFSFHQISTKYLHQNIFSTKNKISSPNKINIPKHSNPSPITKVGKESHLTSHFTNKPPSFPFLHLLYKSKSYINTSFSFLLHFYFTSPKP